MTEYTKEEIREHRQQWVNSLRAETYPQGTNRLVGKTGYCCLGVACELSGVAARHDVVESLVEPGTQDVRTCYDGAWAHLPDSVSDWLGLQNDNPYIQVGCQWITLSQLNDMNTPHKVIAALIDMQADDWDGLYPTPDLVYTETSGPTFTEA